MALSFHSEKGAKKSMSKGNKPTSHTDLLTKLHQARALVDECIAEIKGQPRHKSVRILVHSPRQKSAATPRDLDFEANERAFVKAHARGLSGPKKFALLVAYLAKGKVGTEVELKEVQKYWNRMTAPNLLDGKFNRFYTNSAKESGWVNTKKQGIYLLRPSWTQVLKS
ncbi:MAG: hypothetical protein ACXV7C_11575 [Candidatus Angelobacter sp.]